MSFPQRSCRSGERGEGGVSARARFCRASDGKRGFLCAQGLGEHTAPGLC